MLTTHYTFHYMVEYLLLVMGDKPDMLCILRLESFVYYS
jgi:hypothetical protein